MREVEKLPNVNEFVVRFANVNGTGSASANGMFAKALFRLGLPIGPKNMFPSNIQGLPTWYEVRVSEKGYTGRRGGVDIMVAMNPQTFDADIAALDAGGYFIYDAARFVGKTDRRKDINYLPIPLTELALSEFTNPKTRPMLKNIVYVGVLGALVGIEKTIFETLLKEMFSAKPKVLDSNIHALQIGYDYVAKKIPERIPLRVVTPKGEKQDCILLNGNEAAGLGCVYGGATVAAWYPITPSTSLVDAFAKYCRKFRVNADGKNRFAIVQAEDELASIGMVLGANWNGARSFTATSGPGISLMSEFLGFAYYAEIPAVVFNVQRCGPSTGMPTRTQQADLLLCAYASHGDTKYILLFPATPAECFEFAALSFDLAESYQTPVIVMSELELGMNDYVSKPLTWDDQRRYARGKVLNANELDRATKPFYRYLDLDNDGVPYRTLPGVSAKGAYFTRGSGHDHLGRYTEDGALYKQNFDRLCKKYSQAVSSLPRPELLESVKGRSKKLGVICVGTTIEPLREAVDLLQTEQIFCDVLRIRAFPFSEEVLNFIENHEDVIVIDQNRDAQLLSLLKIEFNLNPSKLKSICMYDGLPLMARELVKAIRGISHGAQSL